MLMIDMLFKYIYIKYFYNIKNIIVCHEISKVIIFNNKSQYLFCIIFSKHKHTHTHTQHTHFIYVNTEVIPITLIPIIHQVMTKLIFPPNETLLPYIDNEITVKNPLVIAIVIPNIRFNLSTS